jgi:hypothetical protein
MGFTVAGRFDVVSTLALRARAKPDAGSRGWSPGLLLRARESNSLVLVGFHQSATA